MICRVCSHSSLQCSEIPELVQALHLECTHNNKLIDGALDTLDQPLYMNETIVSTPSPFQQIYFIAQIDSSRLGGTPSTSSGLFFTRLSPYKENGIRTLSQFSSHHI
jgi:hypothetical protein